MTRKGKLPPPHPEGPADPLSARFSMTPAAHAAGDDTARTTSIPARTSSTRRYGQGSGRSRPDPAGMCRESYYLSTEARDALAVAVDQVLAALGGDVPKHVAVSALINAGAAAAGQVAADLASERARELAAQIEALNHGGATRPSA